MFVSTEKKMESVFTFKVDFNTFATMLPTTLLMNCQLKQYQQSKYDQMANMKKWCHMFPVALIYIKEAMVEFQLYNLQVTHETSSRILNDGKKC